AIQSALKKLFKIKSLHIEQSLVQLVYHALDKDSRDASAAQATKPPLLQRILGRSHLSASDPLVKGVYGSIVTTLKQLGRVSFKGNLMLDSISKEDLKKCLERAINGPLPPNPILTEEQRQALRDDLSKILARIDEWYGTVMQSFEERYTRSMKTWALIISAAIVILLNANFFSIYRNIAVSEAVRNNILQTQGEISKRLAEKETGGEAPATETLRQWYDESRQAIMDNAQFYTGFGFTNMKPRQVWYWVSRSGGWENVGAWPWFAHGLYVLTGLIVMTLLLSVGAPFWQDALESLFGIKNLLRQKSGTKNVEDSSGQGQPRT
ncbi:MAG TPA: hypothetical protein VJT09_19530, partial [Pyrinomonadaceae bacterium]|nr:hypothetical protein [Pyrinomonadaceae bacterium]